MGAGLGRGAGNPVARETAWLSEDQQAAEQAPGLGGQGGGVMHDGGALRIAQPRWGQGEFGIDLHWSNRAHQEPANRWLRQLAIDLFRESGAAGDQSTSKKRISTSAGRRSPVPRNTRSIIQPSAGALVSNRGTQRK